MMKVVVGRWLKAPDWIEIQHVAIHQSATCLEIAGVERLKPFLSSNHNGIVSIRVSNLKHAGWMPIHSRFSDELEAPSWSSLPRVLVSRIASLKSKSQHTQQRNPEWSARWTYKETPLPHYRRESGGTKLFAR